MSPELQLLIQLQDLDTHLDRVRHRIGEMPLAEQALQARVTERTSAVNGVKERIATSQAHKREIEKELAAIQTRLSKFKGQLMEVKTNKEYQAMQKEMAVAETEIRGHEDRMLDQMEEAEVLAAELKAAEAALKAEQADVSKAQQALATERAGLEKELEEHSAARQAIVSQLPAATISLFERIALGRRGLAVAEARDGLCTACHVRLRPQSFNEIRRNDGLHQCDSCTRILYFVPQTTQPAES
ncbi:MAG TPA: C4-type zinc ribbon domain-containing protein [Vicinamibacterales bacterium]